MKCGIPTEVLRRNLHTSKDDIITLIDEISKNSSKINNAFLQDSIKSLNSNITTTKSKINSIKTNNGEEAQ